MPSVFGAWAPNSTASLRGQIEILYTVPAAAPGATTVPVTVIVYIKAGPTGWADSTNTLSWSGSLLGAGSVNNVAINLTANQRLQIRSFIKDVTLTSSTQGMTFAASLSGINQLGSNPSATVAIPIPRQNTASPATKPANAAATYNPNSDSVSLTWGGGYVHRIESAWRPLTGGDWTAYSLVGDSTFESGTGAPVVPGRQYSFRILRRVAGVNSDWAYTPVIHSVTTPNAPSSVSVTQNSDKSHAVTWAFTATTAEHTPSTFVVQRWRASTNSWVQVANPWAATRAWSDSTDLTNDRAAWRVAAKNTAGQSAWVTSAYVMTSPEAASDVVASRTGPTSSTVTWKTWTPTATGVTQDLQVQTSEDESTWTGWSNFTGRTGMSGALNTTTLTDLDSSLSYRFRIVTRVTTPTTRTATSRPSGTVTLPQAPGQPTPVTPLSHSANSSLENVVHEWGYNTLDGSPQQAFRLRYRNVTTPATPGAWVVVSGTTDTSVPLSLTTGDWEWQVQTRGSHAVYSDYSDPIVYSVFAPPSVNITSPSTPLVTTNRPTVTYTYTDSKGNQKTQIRRLLDGSGDVIEEVHTNTASTSFQFSTLLTNFEAYSIEVLAVSNTGLTSVVDSHSFSTDFLVPGAPVLTGSWSSETGVATFQGTNMTGATITSLNRLERSVDGGPWELVENNLNLNPQVIDEFTQLNSSVRYQLISVSSLGTESRSNTVTLFTETMSSWLHYGPGLSHKMRMTCEISNDMSFSTGVTTHKLLGRAKRVPVHALGWSPEVRIQVSASVIDVFVGNAERELMEASQGNVYWRDYQQRRMWAVIPSGDGKPEWKYSFIGFTLEEIEGALPSG